MTAKALWTLRSRLAYGILSAERAADRWLSASLRSRPGWAPTVSPYVSYGTPDRVHVRGRVLLGRIDDQAASPTRRRIRLPVGLPPFLSLEVPGERVTVEVAGQVVETAAGPDGYVECLVDLPGLSPGWHQISFAVNGRPESATAGRLLVVDPALRLGIVSDIDDTIVHTGLTRLVEAVRTTLFTPEHARAVVAGTSELYHALLSGDKGPGQIFYVSTGAWNLHPALQRFLTRHSFPDGPLLMTDWGPSDRWMFREASEAFKARVITQLFDEYPQLMWVLVGDSGQDDPQAYATVAQAQPGRVHAVYIRDVAPASRRRADRVRRLTDALEKVGVPVLLVPDSITAADHALSVGLIDGAACDRVHRAVETGTPAPGPGT
jgi:phosphatidate phosphatase APP1